MFDQQPEIRRHDIVPAAAGRYLTETHNVVLFGPSGTGKTRLATAVDWVARLQDAHQHGRLPAELTKLRRYALIIIDEVGYLPFEQDAANLSFQVVSTRYGHASPTLTNHPPFAR